MRAPWACTYGIARWTTRGRRARRGGTRNTVVSVTKLPRVRSWQRAHGRGERARTPPQSFSEKKKNSSGVTSPAGHRARTSADSRLSALDCTHTRHDVTRDTATHTRARPFGSHDTPESTQKPVAHTCARDAIGSRPQRPSVIPRTSDPTRSTPPETLEHTSTGRQIAPHAGSTRLPARPARPAPSTPALFAAPCT